MLKAIAIEEYETIASKAARRRVLWKIAALSVDPRPTESRQLPERRGQYRLCLAQNRVIYQIDEPEKQVTVFRIVHRRSKVSTW